MSAAREQFLYGPANFLIVARGLFQPAALRQVRREIEKRRAAVVLADERARQAAEVGVAPDALRLSEDWYEIWKDAALDRFRTYVPDFSEVIYPPQIRTVRHERALVPWHQDSSYMKSLGPRGHAEVITVFVPLDEDPRERPTLQFALDPAQAEIDALVREGVVFNKFDVAAADVPAPERRRSFALELGDAFVFGMHVLHRTHFVSDRGLERTSMEFRLTRPACLLPGKDYFSLRTLRFHRTGGPA